MKSILKIAGYILAGVVILCVGIYIGFTLSSNKYSGFLASVHLVRSSDPSYPLVHPIVNLQTPDALSIGEFKPLASKVQTIFSENSTILKRYSVYFRDLNTGFWFGIDETDQYDPASMLKVALAMGAYKEAEDSPSFLNQSEIYTNTLAALDATSTYDQQSELVVGQSYTVSDLIKKMIVDSDNGAKDVLGNVVDPGIMNDLYSELGITPPNDNTEFTISARKYSQFFRTLYNGTYLNEADSNRLLSLLTETTYTKALTGGVPAGVFVAHKYGEHVVSSDNTVSALELHDCGIVYDAKNPYVLCVMTQGKDEVDLEQVISSVSAVVYQEVTGGYK